jgi:hypothetical protein
VAPSARSAALFLIPILLAAATPAGAQGPAPPDSLPRLPASPRLDAAPVDSAAGGPRPFLVMARSAVVPGWGQVYNRQPLKAILVVAGEGLLAYKILDELRLQNEAIDRRAAAVEGTLEYAAADADELTHRNRKIDWIWWTAAAHLLQMADAYVDAHFRHFDAEFGTDDAREGAARSPRLSLAFRVRF